MSTQEIVREFLINFGWAGVGGLVALGLTDQAPTKPQHWVMCFFVSVVAAVLVTLIQL